MFLFCYLIISFSANIRQDAIIFLIFGMKYFKIKSQINFFKLIKNNVLISQFKFATELLNFVT